MKFLLSVMVIIIVHQFSSSLSTNTTAHSSLSFSRCGWSWGSANQSCGEPCATDLDCRSLNESFCFYNLSIEPCINSVQPPPLPQEQPSPVPSPSLTPSPTASLITNATSPPLPPSPTPYPLPEPPSPSSSPLSSIPTTSTPTTNATLFTTRCGSDWSDANAHCYDPCTAEGGCASPQQQCFADLSMDPCLSSPSPSPSPSSPSPSPSLSRCGSSWVDANEHCYASCTATNVSACALLQQCFADLSTIPCLSLSPSPSHTPTLTLTPFPSPSPPPSSLSTVRCGSNWFVANTNCKTACTTNADCAVGDSCWAGLSTVPCQPPAPEPVLSTSRCGLSWSEAYYKCGATCDGVNLGCVTPEQCWAGLTLRPCMSPSPSSTTRVSSSRCGTDWAAASRQCNRACTDNYDCTASDSGWKCFANLTLVACMSSLPMLPRSRCGLVKDPSAARTACGRYCEVDENCMPDERCYFGLPVSPCVSAINNNKNNSVVIVDLRCGTTREESESRCGVPCEVKGDEACRISNGNGNSNSSGGGGVEGQNQQRCWNVSVEACLREEAAVSGDAASIDKSRVGVIVGAIVGILLLVALIMVVALLLFKKREDILLCHYNKQPSLYWPLHCALTMGQYVDGIYLVELTSTTKQFQTAMALLIQNLDGSNVSVISITTVYSPRLFNLFVTKREVQEQRFQGKMAHLFSNQLWKNEDDVVLKSWVYEKFNQKISLYSWNNEQTVPVIPVIHATDFSKAMHICRTGFATLCKLDEGWYGQGMYFTSSAQYALTYVVAQKVPCLVVAYVCPGNAYPVVNTPDNSKSFFGKPLKSGYQSHYICTDCHGYPITQITNDICYDELVIAQEDQVVPVFVIKVKIDRHASSRDKTKT